MEIRNSFTVSAPPDPVFTLLLDLQRVGPCIPGATIEPVGADGSHYATIAVKLGLVRLEYMASCLAQRLAAVRPQSAPEAPPGTRPVSWGRLVLRLLRPCIRRLLTPGRGERP